jgi:predicted metal-dependent hydrolase
MSIIDHQGCFVVQYKGENISVCLTRKQVKNINLRIKSDRTVAVSAAREVPLQLIEDLVRKKGEWILRHFARYAHRQNISQAKTYQGGEKLNYLGQTYNLVVQPALRQEEVLFDSENVYLLVRDGRSCGEREEMIEQWYREKAKLFFKQSLERIYPLLAGQGVTKPELKIRKMKTRWGSCSLKTRKVTLNLELIKMSPAVIDYVVLHELIHFIHQNHGKAFYNCLGELMPDWKERRRHLKDLSL